MDSREYLQRRLACLGDPSRFRILASLQAGRLCVSDLARAVRLSQSCTTRHLQALSAVGVVRPEREGKRVVYVIRDDDPEVARLVGWLAPGGAPGTGPPMALPDVARAPRVRGPRTPAAPAAVPPPPAESAPPLTDRPSAGEVASDEVHPVPEARAWRRPSDLEDFLL